MNLFFFERLIEISSSLLSRGMKKDSEPRGKLNSGERITLLFSDLELSILRLNILCSSTPFVTSKTVLNEYETRLQSMQQLLLAIFQSYAAASLPAHLDHLEPLIERTKQKVETLCLAYKATIERDPYPFFDPTITTNRFRGCFYCSRPTNPRFEIANITWDGINVLVPRCEICSDAGKRNQPLNILVFSEFGNWRHWYVVSEYEPTANLFNNPS